MSNPGSPYFTPPASSREGLQLFWRIYEAHFDEITAHLIEVVRADPRLSLLIDVAGEENLEASSRESRARLRSGIMDGDWQPYLEDLDIQGRAYAAAGIEFQDWFRLLTSFRNLTRPLVIAEYGDDREALTAALGGMNDVADVGLAGLGQAYLSEQRRLISAQEEAIRELSTPVLQLDDRMLILPVVGVLDTNRARHLTEKLLEQIRAVRALVVIIDITGVPNVDSRVAHHLIQAVEAAALMGATGVLTGIAPNVAQTLVALGVNLGSVQTAADLQGGVELARRIVGATTNTYVDRGLPSAGRGGKPAD